MKPTTLLYKVLRKDGTSTFQDFAWPLPTKGKPGKWLRVKGPPEMCRNGLHLTADPLAWRQGNDCRLFVAEAGRECVLSYDKAAFRRARLLYEITPKMAAVSPDVRVRAFFAGPKANLYGADLSGANLSGANLYGADLSGANLSGANLYGANLYGASRPTSGPSIPGWTVVDGRLARAAKVKE